MYKNDRKPTVEELLADYATKPVKHFFQVDGFADQWGDTVTGHDEAGHALTTGGWEWELRNTGDKSAPVRAMIAEDARKEDVVALFRKMADWLERDWYSLTVPEFHERIVQASTDAFSDLLNSDIDNDEDDNEVDDKPF